MNVLQTVPGGQAVRWLAALMLLTALAGCGFHLQGNYTLPAGVDGVYVVYHNAYVPGQPPLVDMLQQRLRMNDALGGPDADARIVVRSVSNRNSGISTSPINADTVEYRLQSTVVFDYIVNGKALLSGERFAMSRYYTASEATQLSSATERKQLAAGMQRELVNRMLFRIRNVSQQQEADNE